MGFALFAIARDWCNILGIKVDGAELDLHLGEAHLLEVLHDEFHSTSVLAGWFLVRLYRQRVLGLWRWLE